MFSSHDSSVIIVFFSRIRELQHFAEMCNDDKSRDTILQKSGT